MNQVALCAVKWFTLGGSIPLHAATPEPGVYRHPRCLPKPAERLCQTDKAPPWCAQSTHRLAHKALGDQPLAFRRRVQAYSGLGACAASLVWSSRASTLSIIQSPSFLLSARDCATQRALRSRSTRRCIAASSLSGCLLMPQIVGHSVSTLHFPTSRPRSSLYWSVCD